MLKETSHRLRSVSPDNKGESNKKNTRRRIKDQGIAGGFAFNSTLSFANLEEVTGCTYIEVTSTPHNCKV